MDGAALMEFAFYGICCGLVGPLLIVLGFGLMFWAYCKMNDLI